MKIAIVSPTPTHPVTAGNRARILAMARCLMEFGHEVHFVFAAAESGDRVAMSDFFGAARFHWMDVSNTGQPSGLARRVRRLLRKESCYVSALDDWYNPSLTDALRKLQALERFDAVMVEYVFLSKAFDAFGSDAAKILDTHDMFGDRHKTYLKAGQQPAWYSTTPEDEVRGLRRADIVVAIQEEEAQQFRSRLGSERVRTVSHFLEFGNPVKVTDIAACSFLASANPINANAAKYFIARILPLVRDKVPDFTFVLAGQVCDEIRPASGVQTLGYVQNFSEALSRAPFLVVPVHSGTGVSIKLLEGLAAGVPIVSTETGARGIDKRFRDAIRIVPDAVPEVFAREILEILCDGQIRAEMASAARAAAIRWNAAQKSALASMLAEARDIKPGIN